jgi:hypothetical protein
MILSDKSADVSILLCEFLLLFVNVKKHLTINATDLTILVTHLTGIYFKSFNLWILIAAFKISFAELYAISTYFEAFEISSNLMLFNGFLTSETFEFSGFSMLNARA